MHFCGITEARALFAIPYQRGLQYIHAALLTQGAHCIRPEELNNQLDAITATHSELVKQYGDSH